jgi:oxygen-independent coproporphyrinogen-3 oxidase
VTVSLDAILDGTRYESYVYAYPHKTAYREIAPALRLADVWRDEPRRALFLYVHVPFCEQRCGFCNLFTRPVPPDELVERYVGALARQTRVVRDELARGGDAGFARAAIGGGTPTLLGARQLDRVLDLMATGMGAPLGAIPMSVETSPETALPDRLAVVVGRGATRISIGVQSFVDAECRAVNRPQQATEVHRALRAIRDARPATLNIDLMYGLPGQTDATWRSTLLAALEYAPEELYLYPLYVRPLTTLGRRGAKAADRDRVALYEQGRAILFEAGYRQVSMRMFRRIASTEAAAPVYACQADGMVGLGCGARSYTRRVHYSSEWAVGARGVRDIIDRWVARDDDAFAVADYGFVLDDDEQRRRFVVLSLLSDEGVDGSWYRRDFGGTLAADFPEIDDLVARGLAMRDGDMIRLTADGVARADAIGPWLWSPAVRERMAGYDLQ